MHTEWTALVAGKPATGESMNGSGAGYALDSKAAQDDHRFAADSDFSMCSTVKEQEQERYQQQRPPAFQNPGKNGHLVVLACRWSPDRLLLDPYARHVSSRQRWATRDEAEGYQPEVCSKWCKPPRELRQISH